MTTTQLHGWKLEVERGPGWVFVRLVPPQEEPGLIYAASGGEVAPLAEDLWSIVQQNMVDRLVLNMEQVTFLNSHLVGQLVLLHKRIHNRGGIVRLCGLSRSNEEVLHMAGLDKRFPHYDCQNDAIFGTPNRPR